jgi:hypothetical protein
MTTSSYRRCLIDCNQTPGTSARFLESGADWSDSPAPDHIRIESWLASHLDDLAVLAEDAVLLHAGIKNSFFARWFCPLVRAVHGIASSPREIIVARGLCLPNYQTWRVNKYHPQLLSWLDWVPYSFIVDNNLASYACCRRHFHSLLTNYTLMLREDGAILTDRAGLAHTPGDPNWNLVDEIEEVVAGFGLQATWETPDVCAIRKVVSDGE